MAKLANGFTLPEVMLCLVILSFSLPASMHLMAHLATFSHRTNQAYIEDAQVQNWLLDWQRNLPTGKRSGQFADGRAWQIEIQGKLYQWRVDASAISPAEYGWYLPDSKN